MTPGMFARYVNNLAVENGDNPETLVLGGDHLGPYPWQEESAASAMEKASLLVQEYVKAGYTKIHLDASMRLGDDDPQKALDPQVIAFRTAVLATFAETALRDRQGAVQPRYVIGSEVPPPGGACENDDRLHITSMEDVKQTIAFMQSAFRAQGLEGAWDRVIAVVVQPGVEYGDDFVQEYRPELAQDLARFSESTRFVYEAHSTDYQNPDSLAGLVRDHFAILKVGPALTFAFREAVFGLAYIENELILPEYCSRIMEVLEKVMWQEPEHWQKYYRGADHEVRFACKYSLSDRMRYYWYHPQVQRSLDKLFHNLEHVSLPTTLIRQFLPDGAKAIREGYIPNNPTSLVFHHIQQILDGYSFSRLG